MPDKPTDSTESTDGRSPSITCSTLSVVLEEASITEHPKFREVRNDWGVIPAHFENVEWDEYGEPIIRQWVTENRDGHRPELDGKSLADMWDAEKGDWAIQPPGMEGITSFLRPKYSCLNAELRDRHLKQTPPEKENDQ